VAQHEFPPSYAERLRVPWWAWPASIVVGAFFAMEIFLGARTGLGIAVFVAVSVACGAGLLVLGRIPVRVDSPETDGPELRVDDAHIPVRFVTEVNVLDAAARAALLGPLAEPNVFAIHRPWIRGAVRVVIDDPADPTPYWVISTRRPDDLARSIVAARDASATSAAPLR
jgi:hypothetical protein